MAPVHVPASNSSTMARHYRRQGPDIRKQCYGLELRPGRPSWRSRVLTYTGIRYSTINMIRSFGDARTQTLFRDEFVRDFQGIARRAKRRLEAINAAHRLDDLLVPPSNRLEKLKGNLKGFFSIRINDQWRVIFKWVDGDAYDVRIIDYH